MLQFAETRYDTACPMFALVAMYQYGMVTLVHEYQQSIRQYIFGHICKWFLVACHAELKEPNVVALQKVQVGVWVIFEHKRQNTLQSQTLEKGKVLAFGEAAAVHERCDHAKVVGWIEGFVLGFCYKSACEGRTGDCG
jgi:hypothetical protein